MSGAIGEPGMFYVGTPNGGVWKTTSSGATWYPIFDSIKTTSSIGAIAVAPSDPNVIYVGTGDLNSFFDGIGDGMYKSPDAGRTWRRVGLDGTQQITSILVHPRDPNLVLVGALGEFALELNAQDNADLAPTQATLAEARSSCDELRKVVGRWTQIVQRDVPTLNQVLARHGVTALATPPAGGKLCSR